MIWVGSLPWELVRECRTAVKTTSWPIRYNRQVLCNWTTCLWIFPDVNDSWRTTKNICTKCLSLRHRSWWWYKTVLLSFFRVLVWNFCPVNIRVFMNYSRISSRRYKVPHTVIFICMHLTSYFVRMNINCGNGYETNFSILRKVNVCVLSPYTVESPNN